MKGHTIHYSAAELLWIKFHRDLPRREAHAQFTARFGRADVSLKNYSSLCKRNGWATGRTGRYEPGLQPHYKGQRMAFNANSAATRFQPGSTPPNRLPMGSERMTDEGYVEMKVPQENPYTGAKTRFVQKHRWNWEQANGPIPEGHVLKCLDGDKTNCDPSNWTAIPRALLPRLNGRFGRDYDTAPAQIRPAIMAIAQLEHKARLLTRRENRGTGSA